MSTLFSICPARRCTWLVGLLGSILFSPLGLAANGTAPDRVMAIVFSDYDVAQSERFRAATWPYLGEADTPALRTELLKRLRTIHADSATDPERVVGVENLREWEIRDSSESRGVLEVRLLQRQIRLIAIEGLDVADQRMAAQRFRGMQGEAVSAQRLLQGIRGLENRLGRRLVAEIQPMARSAGHGPNAARLVIRERFSLRGQAYISTEGSPRLGRDMVGGWIRARQVYGLIDEARLGYVRTLEADGYQAGSAGFTALMSPESRLSLDLSLGRAQPEDTPERVYRRRWIGVESQHYVHADKVSSLDFSLLLAARDLERRDSGLLNFDESLRYLEMSLSGHLERMERDHRLRVALRQGLDAFGASIVKTGSTPADSNFFRLRIDYSYWRPLNWGMTLRADIDAQAGQDSLPPSQQFFVGLGDLLTAYIPGELSGDSGIAGRIEVRRGWNTANPFQARWVPYIYYALGAVTQSGLDADDRQSAAAGGLGLRFRAGPIRGWLDAGKPLTAASSRDGQSIRINAKLALGFGT